MTLTTISMTPPLPLRVGFGHQVFFCPKRTASLNDASLSQDPHRRLREAVTNAERQLALLQRLQAGGKSRISPASMEARQTALLRAQRALTEAEQSGK